MLYLSLPQPRYPLWPFNRLSAALLLASLTVAAQPAVAGGLLATTASNPPASATTPVGQPIAHQGDTNKHAANKRETNKRDPNQHSPHRHATRLETLTVTARHPLQLKQPQATASRLSLSALQTPASVDTLTEQQWRRRGDSSVRDIVSRSTGITDIGNLGSGNAYSARGFTGNNSVAQAEDGIRLLTAAGTLTYPSDSWGYQKIDVLRGPAAVLYGDGSVGGLINSIRKAPSQQTQLEGRLRLGADAARQLALGGSHALNDASAIRLDASAIRGNGDVQQGDYQSKKLMSGLSLALSEQLQMRLTLDQADEQPARYTGVPLKQGKPDRRLDKLNFNVADAVQRFRDGRYRWQTEYDNGALQIQNTLLHATARRHWRNVEYFRFLADDRIERSGYTEIRHQQRQTTNRLQVTGTSSLLGAGTRYQLGHEYSSARLNYFDNFYNGNDPVSVIDLAQWQPGVFQTIDPTVADFTAEVRQHALFAEHLWQLTPTLSLVQGIRADEIKLTHQSLLGRGQFDRSYQPLALRSGLVYQLSTEQSLYAQLNRGSDPVSSLLSLRPSNQAFRLTNAHQAEVGYKQQWPEQGEFTAALFSISKQHILTRSESDPRLRVQGGEQWSRGVELSGQWLLSPAFQVEANLSVLAAAYEKLLEAGGVSRAGNLPVNVPKRSANLWLHYSPTWRNSDAGEFRLSSGLRYVSARFADTANTARLPGFRVFDLNASWQLSGQTSVQLSIRNLTDQYYLPVAYDREQVIPGAGRSWSLQLDQRF